MKEKEKDNKPSWRSSQNHLSKALEDWSHISQVVKNENKIAPDQKIKNEMTELLLSLKSQLDEFASPNATKEAPKETTLGTEPATLQE